MAEHNNGAIHIGQVNLRMPGHSADTAHGVVNRVSQSLAEKVPPGTQRRLGALSVRVQVHSGATGAQMSDAVTEAIMRALRK